MGFLPLGCRCLASRRGELHQGQRLLDRHAEDPPLIRRQREQRHFTLSVARPSLLDQWCQIYLGRQQRRRQLGLPAERRYRQSRPALGDHLYGQPRYRLPVLQRPSGRYDRHVPLQHARPADVAYRSHYERLQQDSLQRRPDPQQGYRTSRSTATRSSRCAATAKTTSTTSGSSASRCRSTTTGT